MNILGRHLRGLLMRRTEKQLSLRASPTGSAEKWMANPLEHASGIERAQLVAELGGDADPFDAEPATRGAGTRACPTVVTSCNAFRYVGCVCHPAEPVVTWMVLWRGVPARCRCGFWWRLDPKEPFFDDPCASHH